MVKTVEQHVEELSTLEERCSDGGEHELVPFVYQDDQDEISDFEEICVKAGCGQYKIKEEGIYSLMGLLHYVNSDRYDQLLHFSEKIKNKKNL